MSNKRHQTNEKPPTSARTNEGVSYTLPTLDELVEALCIASRLAAADTVHSTERPETVFKRAIDEGIMAYNMLKSALNAKK